MLETVGPNVALKRMEGFRVAYVQHRGPPAEIGLAFRKLLQLLHEWRIHPVGPPMAIHYREPGEREDARSWSEAAVPIAGWTKPHNEVRTKAMPTCEVASCIFDGPPSRFLEAYAALHDWIRGNGYERAGPIREVYARDLSELPPGILYAELQVPVRRAHRE